MMPTRWIVVGMQAFVAAAVAGLTFAMLGPVALVRMLGWTGFALASAGTLWHVYLLRKYDPHAWSVFWHRNATTIDRVGMQWSRARYALAHGTRGITAANP